ncbi:unnamed protein product [Effrenium voratum]|nr:unnamed protein product [Effrenium voratum]
MARREAREMRRFARPGRGRHDLGGLCGHGAGTSRDLTARSTALTRPAWSANSADAKTASAQFCWRCGELIRQGLPLTEADGKTERTDEAKTKAKGWKRKSPSTWSVALAAPASLAAAADSGGQCLRRAPLPNDEGQETAITVPPDTRLSRPSRKRGLAALGAFSLCSWPSQAMTQSKVDSDVTHTFLNAWDADTLQAVRGFVMLLTKCA